MGSWDETCALSHLPISGGEVVFLLLTESPYVCNSTGVGPSDFHFVRSIPIYGAYVDCGEISPHKSEKYKLELLKRQFGLDLIPQKSHRLPQDINMDNYTFSRLQSWLHEGEVTVDKNMSQRADVVGDEDEDEFKLPVVPSVVRKVLIRKDVWDSILQVTIPYYSLSEQEEKISEYITKELNHYTKKQTKNEIELMLGEVKAGRVILKSDDPTYANNLFTVTKIALQNVVAMNPTEAELKSMVSSVVEMSFISAVICASRMNWNPTCGSGSQEVNFDVSLRVHNRMANVARAAIENEIKDINENFDISEDQDAFNRVENLKKVLGESISHSCA